MVCERRGEGGWVGVSGRAKDNWEGGRRREVVVVERANRAVKKELEDNVLFFVFVLKINFKMCDFRRL